MKICFDTETTGLSPEHDEILQLSILNGDTGEVLYNRMFKPAHKKRWPDAEKCNHISPLSVMFAPHFGDKVAEIKPIFDAADEWITYNGVFDMRFLTKYGICPGQYTVMSDVMVAYKQYYGKRVKLCECAKNLGYTGCNWHNSLSDTDATLFCYNRLVEI